MKDKKILVIVIMIFIIGILTFNVFKNQYALGDQLLKQREVTWFETSDYLIHQLESDDQLTVKEIYPLLVHLSFMKDLENSQEHNDLTYERRRVYNYFKETHLIFSRYYDALRKNEKDKHMYKERLVNRLKDMQGIYNQVTEQVLYEKSRNGLRFDPFIMSTQTIDEKFLEAIEENESQSGNN